MATAPAVPTPPPPAVAVPGADGLWSIEVPLDEGWGLRCAVVQLTDGSHCVVSPVRKLAGVSADALGLPGRPSFYLAPNHFHHLGLDSHLAHHPDARAVASQTALPRLRSRVKSPLASLDALRERLPAHMTVLEPPGLKNGEVWLRAHTPAGVAWVVSDAFFNMPRHAPGVLGWFLRQTQTTAGLRIGSTFKWLGIGEKKAYAAWLRAQIDADQPTVLVPGHGDVLHDATLPAQLRALVDERLD